MIITDRDGIREGERITWVGVLANLVLVVCKLAAGYVGHSQALIADAFHSISDFFTDFTVLVGLRLGRKAPDSDHHFGHARIETMASAIVGGSLVAVAILLGYNSARDIYYHTESHPTWPAVAGAALSIGVKEILYRYTVRAGQRIKSSAVVANAWHHRSDALSSVAVLIGVSGALIRPEWHILDAYAALVVSFLILKVGLDVLWGAAREMADTAPAPEVMSRIRTCINGVPNVLDIHDLKVRSMGGRHSMVVHIVVDRTMTVEEGHRTAKEVEHCLLDEIEDIGEVVIHIDPAGPREGS